MNAITAGRTVRIDTGYACTWGTVLAVTTDATGRPRYTVRTADGMRSTYRPESVAAA